MTWFMQQRQDFIRAQLETYGMIRRADIADRFEVTIQIASADIAAFIAAHPGAIDYDRSVKCYVYDARTALATSPATATEGVRDHAGSVREVDTIKIRLSPTSDEVHSLGRVVRWERASDPAAITPTEVSALRYLLNWSDTPRKQVGSILKTFTLDGEERTYTKDALESLWRKLSAALHPVDSRAQGGEK